jgi:hypothetical protein
MQKATISRGFLIGAPKGIRTPDLLFRRQTLYPAELWAHILFLVPTLRFDLE